VNAHHTAIPAPAGLDGAYAATVWPHHAGLQCCNLYALNQQLFVWDLDLAGQYGHMPSPAFVARTTQPALMCRHTAPPARAFTPGCCQSGLLGSQRPFHLPAIPWRDEHAIRLLHPPLGTTRRHVRHLRDAFCHLPPPQPCLQYLPPPACLCCPTDTPVGGTPSVWLAQYFHHRTTNCYAHCGRGRAAARCGQAGAGIAIFAFGFSSSTQRIYTNTRILVHLFCRMRRVSLRSACLRPFLSGAPIPLPPCTKFLTPHTPSLRSCYFVYYHNAVPPVTGGARPAISYPPLSLPQH